jgi:hypothetical protein
LQIWAAPAIAKIPEEARRLASLAVEERTASDASLSLFADLGCACDRENP